MTTMRFITRLLPQKWSPSPSPRWLFTVAAEPPAETEAATQRRKRTRLFYKVVSDHSHAPHVLDNWVNQGNEVKRSDFLNLTNYFRKRNNFQAALQICNWMEGRNFDITNADKAVRIDLLCQTEGIASAENYFNALQESEKTSKVYRALLCSYCKQQLVNKALDTFNLMKSLNFTTTLIYNNVLHLHYSMGKYENLFSLVHEMEEENIPLDIYTYNMLINSHGAVKNLDAIECVVKEMKSKNMADDLFTLGNLATIYFNNGLLEKAKAYLNKMEKTTALPEKGLFEAYRTQMNLHTQMNDLQGVLRAWRALKSDFPNPNNTSYLFVLQGLAKLGDQEDLEKVFKEWEENMPCFDPRVPNVLLEYYLKWDMMEKANSLYASLVDRKRRSNLRTLDLFASLKVRNGDVDSGLKHLEMGMDKVKSREICWFPREETIKIFLKYFEQNDDPGRARKFAERMDLKRLDLDALAGEAKAYSAY